MANENAGIDNNFTRSLLGVSSVDSVSTVKIYADPTTHRLLVDLAGGVYTASLGQEVPTGTVNGVNTVFTVQNNPIFGEVSGQVMVSSVQNPSNYGYTITGTGPYTLTYVNAPTQAPDSFYNYPGAGSSLASLFETDQFTATNGQTVFTTTLTPIFVFGVYQNGQLLTPTIDYAQSGSAFTLTSGAVTGDKIQISYVHN